MPHRLCNLHGYTSDNITYNITSHCTIQDTCHEQNNTLKSIDNNTLLLYRLHVHSNKKKADVQHSHKIHD